MTKKFKVTLEDKKYFTYEVIVKATSKQEAYEIIVEQLHSGFIKVIESNKQDFYINSDLITSITVDCK